MLSPLPITLGLLVFIAYLFLLSTINTIPRSHSTTLLPRIFQYAVGRNVSCQAAIVFNSDEHRNINADPLPLFLDRSFYPDCFLEQGKFSDLLKSLNYARRIEKQLVTRLFKALGILKRSLFARFRFWWCTALAWNCWNCQYNKEIAHFESMEHWKGNRLFVTLRASQ